MKLGCSPKILALSTVLIFICATPALGTSTTSVQQTLDYIGAYGVQDYAAGTSYWPAIAGQRTANNAFAAWSTDYTTDIAPRDYISVSAADAGYGGSITFNLPGETRTMTKDDMVRALLTRYGSQAAFYSQFTNSGDKTFVNSTTISAALQMAIWEIKYDNGQGWTSGQKLTNMHTGTFIGGYEVASVDRTDPRLSTVLDGFGGQFGESAYGDLTGPGGSLDGTMSTTYAHLWLRDIIANPVPAGSLIDVAFLEAYNPVTGGFTDGQGLIAVVPEPATLCTLLLSGSSLAGYIRRRLRK